MAGAARIRARLDRLFAAFFARLIPPAALAELLRDFEFPQAVLHAGRLVNAPIRPGGSYKAHIEIWRSETSAEPASSAA